MLNFKSWDDSFLDLEDIKEEIKGRVAKALGYRNIRVKLSKEELIIDARIHRKRWIPGTLFIPTKVEEVEEEVSVLHYSFWLTREYVGRVGRLFSFEELRALRAALNASAQ